MFDLLNLVRGRWSGARDPEVPLAGIAADGPSKRRSPCLRLKPKQKFEIPMFYYLTEEQRLAIVVVRPREFRPLFFRVRWSANRPTAFKSPGDYACGTITYVTYLRVEKRFLEKGTSFLSIDLNRMREFGCEFLRIVSIDEFFLSFQNNDEETEFLIILIGPFFPFFLFFDYALKT